MSEEPTSRFWGLILQPGKCYKQTVQKDFHMSMATLDTAKATRDCRVQVKVEVNGSAYIICQLKADQVLQHPLDLMFDAGDKISCMVEGTSPQPVHLTGYYTDAQHEDFMPLDDDEQLEEEEGMEDEEEQSEDEAVYDAAQKKMSANKKTGKNNKSCAEVNQQSVKAGKRKKMNGENGLPAKMSKLSDSLTLDSSCLEESEDEDNEISGIEEEDEEDEEGFSDDSDGVKAEDESGSEEEDDYGEEEDEEEEETENGKDLSPSFSRKGNKSAQAKAETQKTEAKNKKASEKLAKSEKQKKQSAKENQPPSAKKANGVVKLPKRTISGGVMVEDLVVGSGAEAKQGRSVTVYYKGVLQQNNKQFDATTSGPGFKFRLGGGEVIKGWDRGVEGMCVGGKRRITCPPAMAYGKKGCHPVIPGNSTLVFEVTLKNVQ